MCIKPSHRYKLTVFFPSLATITACWFLFFPCVCEFDVVLLFTLYFCCLLWCGGGVLKTSQPIICKTALSSCHHLGISWSEKMTTTFVMDDLYIQNRHTFIILSADVYFPQNHLKMLRFSCCILSIVVRNQLPTNV